MYLVSVQWANHPLYTRVVLITTHQLKEREREGEEKEKKKIGQVLVGNEPVNKEAGVGVKSISGT